MAKYLLVKYVTQHAKKRSFLHSITQFVNIAQFCVREHLKYIQSNNRRVPGVELYKIYPIEFNRRIQGIEL